MIKENMKYILSSTQKESCIEYKIMLEIPYFYNVLHQTVLEHLKSLKKL